MEITLVKAARPGDRDRVYLQVDGVTRRGPIHVAHDLPHLVIESLFGIHDGLWGELAAGFHAGPGRAVTARDPKRQKQGRIVSGAAAGAPTGEWLTPGHRRAKTITNCVVNRWGDGPDTPGGVRERVARENSQSLEDLLAHLDDKTIAMAIRGVRDLAQRWTAVPPGGKLRLSWPLGRDFFAQVGREPIGRAMTSLATHLAPQDLRICMSLHDPRRTAARAQRRAQLRTKASVVTSHLGEYACSRR
jgi:hypothetical protein